MSTSPRTSRQLRCWLPLLVLPLVVLVVSQLACQSAAPPSAIPPSPSRAATATSPLEAPSGSSPRAAGVVPLSWELLGQAILPKGSVDDTEVGGLSALAYDAADGTWLALSDDASLRAPARLYRLRVTVDGATFGDGDVETIGQLPLRDFDGRPFAPRTLDPEGLVWLPDGGLFISSEGFSEDDVEPWIRHFDAAGRSLSEFPLPRHARPRGHAENRDGSRGVRANLGFESLSRSPSGQWLFTASENALAQDGERATVDAGSPVRLMRWALATGDKGPRLDAEYLYLTEPVPHPATSPDGLALNGLVEVVALSDTELLTLERAYSAGVGNTVRLFHIDLRTSEPLFGGATGGWATARLDRDDDPQPLPKTLLLDFDDLRLDGEPIALDNIEALAFGPSLADGRRTLLLASDDNFSDAQVHQFLLFAVSPTAPTIAQIQGAGHRSPLEDRWIVSTGSGSHASGGVEGVITAVDRPQEVDAEGQPVGPQAFWMQALEGDDDPATSDALYVTPPANSAAFEPQPEQPRTGQPRTGQRVRVRGQVREIATRDGLPVTTLAEATVNVLEEDLPLPAPIVIGAEGRRPPSGWVDDDGLTTFEPATDAIDFFESLESLRVTVAEPLVVGPTSSFGGLVVVADGGENSEPRSGAGGVLLVDSDLNPERVLVDGRLLDDVPEVAVGTRLTDPLTGVMAYSFGAYQLFATEAFGPGVAPNSGIGAPRGGPVPWGNESPEHLTVASYNVLNLDPTDPDDQFLYIAQHIVHTLRGPDVVGLQEIQDDSGPRPRGEEAVDSVVSSAQTLNRLIKRIASVGGPRYEARWVDPEHDVDGGQPGGNIRVAYLFNPQRVQAPLRNLPSGLPPGPRDGARVEIGPQGIYLTPNPARVLPEHPAFADIRKSLALEIHFRDERVFLINNHLKSKRGDDRIFGPSQPPIPHTEAPRRRSTQALRSFIDELLGLDPGARVIVLGDMNEHEFRSPLSALTAAGPAGEPGLVNLIEKIPLHETYTYNYRGNSQILDHILVSPALADGAQIHIPHVNTDRPDDRAGSDHDPVAARLRISTSSP